LNDQHKEKNNLRILAYIFRGGQFLGDNL